MNRFVNYIRATIAMLFAVACNSTPATMAAAVGGCAGAVVTVAVGTATFSGCVSQHPGGTGGAAPFATGGKASTGGAKATGGRSAAGGTAPIATGGSAPGGASATGGTTAIDWPDCAPASQKLEKQDINELRKNLQPYHQGQMHSRAKASYVVLDLPDCGWFPLCPTLDQLNLGSCTGNAATQCRCSDVFGVPVAWVGWDALRLETEAIDTYGKATKIDPYDGTYPPDDTGSNGESVMQVLKTKGLVSGWTTPITFEGLQRALQTGPGIMGSPWHTAMFTPDRCGQIGITGVIEGGHEFVVRAVQYSTKRFLFQNSWGNSWGAKRKGQGGFFWMTFGSVQTLMSEGADFKFPSVSATRGERAIIPSNDNAALSCIAVPFQRGARHFANSP